MAQQILQNVPNADVLQILQTLQLIQKHGQIRTPLRQSQTNKALFKELFNNLMLAQWYILIYCATCLFSMFFGLSGHATCSFSILTKKNIIINSF